MKFVIDKQEKYTLLTLMEGRLDSQVAPKLKAELITLFQSGTTSLILGMEEVKYVDSSGLSALLVARRLSDQHNGTLVLAGLTEHVMRLMQISKLDNVLNLLPTIQESIDFVFMAELEREIREESSDD